MTPLPLVLASGNADKAREMCEVLADVWDRPIAAWAVEVDGTACFVLRDPEPYDVPRPTAVPDVEETGSTLTENARIKARGWARVLHLPALADDTGLFVDALDGAPGVYSSRYAGPGATYADNVEKLLAELRGVERPRRTARFTTVAVAVRPDGTEVSAEGTVEGWITERPRGGAGFGYDPVFVPADGDGRTFAEMTSAEKHARSHRGRAFRALGELLVRGR